MDPFKGKNMLKKTLVAAAIAVGLSSTAFADVHLTNKVGFQTTHIAKQTKQLALDFSTAIEDLKLRFDNPLEVGAVQRELRNNGFILLQIKDNKGAAFNPQHVDSWLTTNDAGTLLSGIAVDLDGGLAVGAGLTSDVTELEKVFKFETLGGTQKRLKYNLQGNVLRLELASNVETLPNANTHVHLLTSSANNIFKLFEDRTGNADEVILEVAAQQDGSFTADLLATPVVFNQKVDLYTLTHNGTTDQGKATALVNTYFENYKLGLNQTGEMTDGEDADIVGKFGFRNNTSNQNIQKEQVRFTLSGNFNGFEIDTASNRLKSQDGTLTPWVVNADRTKAARYLNDAGTSKGNTTEPVEAILYSFVDAATVGDEGLYNLGTPISSGSYSVTSEIAQFNRDALNLFKPVSEINETDTYYPLQRDVANIILVDRDGMRFDTITTGSSASNQIFIRDISNRLGQDGGKILVTVYEYDAMATGQGAMDSAKAIGTIKVDPRTNTLVTATNAPYVEALAHRKPLTTTLPSGGAVTLTPAGIMEELGLVANPARQARMVFEVQTNIGEVAVRKRDESGTDIQNGTRNVSEIRNGNGGLEKADIVDFTL